MNGTYHSVEEALVSALGSSARIVRSDRVSGGDINQAYRLTLEDGTRVFLKANAGKDISFFEAEAGGLTAIAASGCIGVPRVLALGTDVSLGSFLLLEWVERAAKPARYFWENFGRRLAALHRANTTALVTDGRFGFAADNYIGASPQINEPCERWVDFFRDRRLVPQFKIAARWFDAADRKRIKRLLERLGDTLEEPDYPSLLHGDLWSGNFIVGPDGEAWLIDPAAYVGHAETDLAMTELFGGFNHAFYSAYKESAPQRPGYERRRELYNLYHLLNHLNLFGASYLASVRSVLKIFAER